MTTPAGADYEKQIAERDEKIAALEAQVAEAAKAGEFYTPRPIVGLMVRLLDPKSGESVYDPTSGICKTPTCLMAA